MVVFAWKCKTCGCLWRDNLDDTVSLFSAEQRSCPDCERRPTKDACVPTGVPFESRLKACVPTGVPFESRLKAVPEHALYLTSKLTFLTERAKALLNECDVNTAGVYLRHGFNDAIKKLKSAIADPELAPLLRPVQEVCICAAIRFTHEDQTTIIRGHRHNDCILTASKLPRVIPKDVASGTQGFITSHNRFVNREEGRRLQDAAGIPSADPGGYRGGYLYSEDLYSEDLY